MGYELRRALADGLSPSVQGTRRFVLLEIADLAKDDTGLAFSGQWGEEEDLLTIVARRVGLADGKQVGAVLDKLAGTEFETRVQIGVKKTGQPLFCCRGRQTTYDPGALARRLLPRSEVQSSGPSAVVAPPFAGATGGIAPTSEADCSRARAVLHPQTREPALSYSSTQLASSPKPKPVDKVDRVITRHAPDLDRATVARYLDEHGKGLGVVAAADGDGTAPDLFAKIRTWAAPTAQPPRFTDWTAQPPGCGAPGCSRGTVEDPNDDYRPYPCPACQPQRVNGHRT